jgi:hypothetical protein
MRKCAIFFPICEEAVSHIWLCTRSLLFEENFLFFFISVLYTLFRLGGLSMGSIQHIERETDSFLTQAIFTLHSRRSNLFANNIRIYHNTSKESITKKGKVHTWYFCIILPDILILYNLDRSSRACVSRWILKSVHFVLYMPWFSKVLLSLLLWSYCLYLRNYLIIIKARWETLCRALQGLCTLGTSDFDAQMSGIKLWKGDEYLRPV